MWMGSMFRELCPTGICYRISVLCARNETRFKYYLGWVFALKGKRNIIKRVSVICCFSLADFSFDLLLRVNQKSSH
jgi:hypothetical protein